VTICRMGSIANINRRRVFALRLALVSQLKNYEALFAEVSAVVVLFGCGVIRR